MPLVSITALIHERHRSNETMMNSGRLDSAFIM